MKKIRAAIVGYGNIGRCVLEALACAPDFEVAGIVRRVRRGADSSSDVPGPVGELSGQTVVASLGELSGVDVAILCVPSRSVREYAQQALALGIHTVDSFDIHSEIVQQRRALDAAARRGGAAAILAAGWDPGTDSVVRALMEVCAPKGITYTNFGPGMSMGHTVAVKAIPGVRAALSVTIPAGEGIHRRMVYVELEPGYAFEAVAAAIRADAYFVHDQTHVQQVASVDALQDMGHGVHILRKGVSGCTQNQRFEFRMSIDNPALTAQVLVAAARAVLRRQPGAYTLIEVPLIDYLYGEREEIIERLV